MVKQDSNLKVIWFFLRPYKLQAAALLVLSLVVGSLEAASVAAVYPIVSTAFDAGGQDNTLLRLFGTIARRLPIADEFITYCLIFLVIVLLAFTVKMFSIRFRIRFSVNLVKKTQDKIFQKFINADYQYFIDHKQGELIYNVGGAPAAISSLVSAITEMIAQVILFATVIVLLFSLSWPGTVVVLVVGAIYYAFTRYLGERVSYHSGKGETLALQKSGVILNEAISGIKHVKIFSTGEDWVTRFNETTAERWRHSAKRDIWQQVPGPILTLILFASVGIIALFIRIIAPNSFLGLVPTIGTFAFAVFRLVPALSTMSSQGMKIMSVLPPCEIVYDVLHKTIGHIKDGEQEFDSFRSEIEFDKVSFTYPGRDITLKNLSFTIKKSETTAIVGRSGAGKTTIINLLLRLFEPDEGEIKIDGISLNRYRLKSWLRNIGVVSQDTFILNDTVENNITFRSNRYTRNEVERAAKYADAHQFITRLPDGYDTLVGDKGMKLSGGQAQRIAVARAMIRQPEILIFDEATNNLDNISEAAVQRAIDEISKDHTVIIIAHRLSTVARADKIIVLGNECVIEEGTHRQLLANRGAYWELCQREPL